ncbi:uncharacterized protein CDAR_166291 [Caerostris darwini]|uniref:Metal-dependent HD superfamily phosphohydrolase n=1 Tax=Caerostris darwini TaxID=1538125 RepID=A0AAV4S046_9ARAC|nr:uncharacterized protein CDAR_166291 [Caerostris darwini]
MPLTNAEKQKRWREKQKKINAEEYRRKHRKEQQFSRLKKKLLENKLPHSLIKQREAQLKIEIRKRVRKWRKKKLSEMAVDDNEVNAYIYQKWLDLNADVETNIKEKWWNTVKSYYASENRKYHTFVHLKRMFNHLDSLINEIENKNAISYAIFFHDVIYDARSQDNEEESVKLFNKFCTESGILKNEELVSKVEELIMALKAHCTEEHKTEGLFGKDDVHYFLDFDISILGSDVSEYKKYTQQIREEYSFLPKSKYNILRSKVLQLFLQIPTIYATQAFREKYEKQARSNIQTEIEWLKIED